MIGLSTKNKIIPLALFVVVSCFEVLAGQEKDPPKEDPKSQLYLQAKEFNDLVTGKLEPEKREALEKKCRTSPNAHTFCWGIEKWEALNARFQKSKRAQVPYIPPQYDPLAIEIQKGKVQNWNTLRTKHVKKILKGVEQLTASQRQVVKAQALREKRCPNNVAISIAASLEDLLPDQINQYELGKLYELGGRCKNNSLKDREHFLTRSGLFYFNSKNYRNAVRVFSMVQPQDYYHGRALYWLYKSHKEVGNKKAAANAFKQLLETHPLSWHAALGRIEEKKKVSTSFPYLRLQKPSADLGPSRKKAVQSLLRQIEILDRFEFSDTSTLLVDWVLTDMKPLGLKDKLRLIEFGSAHTKASQMPYLFIGEPKLLQTSYLKLSYPQAFFDYFLQNQVTRTPYLLLSIARKESIFNPVAVSHAGARGLLQLLPKTAAKVVEDHPKALNTPPTSLEPEVDVNLLDPKTNIQIAGLHFQELLGQYQMRVPLAISSYNAGTRKVDKWATRYPLSSCALFVDFIPYRETRDYTAMVLSNFYWYLQLYHPHPDEEFESHIQCSQKK